MNKQTDGKEFGKIISIMAEVYGKELNKVVVGVYFETLKEFTIAEVSEAFNKYVREGMYFPKPADIINRINGVDESLDGTAMLQAALVWDSISEVGHGQTIKFKDKTTTAVIDKMFGGWVKLATETVEKEHKWFIKDFINYYKTYKKAGIKKEGKLLGWYDLNNRASGYEIESDVVMVGYDGEDQQQIENISRQRKELEHEGISA